MDKCVQCGAVTLSEGDLHDMVGALNTEDAPTDWAPVEAGTEVMDYGTVTSEDAPTSVANADLPFSVESQPPPPRRQATPTPEAPPVHFSAPPMLTEEFELPTNLADVDRTEEAPKLTMPVTGGPALSAEPRIDLASLREAGAPAGATPADPDDFKGEVTRPAYPLEGTLEPAEELGPYLLNRDDSRQTGTFLLMGVLAAIALLMVGLIGMGSYTQFQKERRGGTEAPALSEVISSSDGRVAVEVEEPSVADVLPPAPKAPIIKVSKTEVPPTRGVVRRPVPVVVPVTASSGSTAPAPAPKPAAAGSYPSLLQQGWSAVTNDPSSAEASFSRALALRSGDPEASYGLGYALWRQDRQAEALPHLCTALGSSHLETQREVNGLLARSNLSCD